MNKKYMTYGAVTLGALLVVLAVITLLGAGHPATGIPDGDSMNGMRDMHSDMAMADEDESILYHCPNHTHEHSTDPDAVCPIDGAGMVPVPADELQNHHHDHADGDGHHDSDHENDADHVYACPMHPDQVSNDPDAKCSICGMNMEEVES